MHSPLVWIGPSHLNSFWHHNRDDRSLQSEIPGSGSPIAGKVTLWQQDLNTHSCE